MPAAFRIARPISIETSMKKEDVVKTKEALRTLGFFRGPVNGIADLKLLDGLRAFQAATGLQADGFMNPGGPTQKLMASLLSSEPSDASSDRVPDGAEPGAAPPSVATSINVALTVNAVVASNAAVGVNVVAAVAVAVPVTGKGRRRL